MLHPRLPIPTFAALFAVLLFVSGCDPKIVASDTTPPEVEITSPAPGALVSGVSFPIQIAVTDDEAVDRVIYRIEGESDVVDDVAPFLLAVVTLGRAVDEPIDIEVEAFDVAGNSASATMGVTVGARTITRITSAPQDDMYPAWSPDGTQIAFHADRDGSQFDIWTMNADGSNQTRRTQNVNEDRHATWSNDGMYLAFESDRMGNFDIWKMPLATGEPDAEAVTTANNDDLEPQWNGFGDRIYFSSNRGDQGDFNIWFVDDPGGDLFQVTSFFEDDLSPAFSMTGRLLSFASALGFAVPHVHVLDPSDGAVSALTGDIGFTETDPAWAPQDRAVTYTRTAGVDANLWMLRSGRVVPQQVTFGGGLAGDGGGAWSPSGDRFAFHSDRDGNLDIFVID